MVRERIIARRHALAVRPRVALTVVGRGDAAEFGSGWMPVFSLGMRGHGLVDYVCGGCGSLLEIGAVPGCCPTALLVCGCGAVNQVPHRRAQA